MDSMTESTQSIFRDPSFDDKQFSRYSITIFTKSAMFLQLCKCTMVVSAPISKTPSLIVDEPLSVTWPIN